MRRRPFYQQAEWRSFAAVTVVAVALIVWHQRGRAGQPGAAPARGDQPGASRVPLPERGVRALLAPVETGVTVAWRETALTVGALGRGRRLAAENAQLKRLLAEKEAKLTERQTDYMDLLQLQKQLGFAPALPATRLLAQVVGRSGGVFLRQTIDLEAADHRQLREADVVCADLGLVGRVISAQGSRARATILVDPNSGAAAVVKPSNSLGSLLGPDPASPDRDLLRLERLDQKAVLNIGDEVLTSPIGDTYPPGLPIGVIEEVVGGLAPGEPKSALVRPYAAFDRLDYVWIIRPPT